MRRATIAKAGRTPAPFAFTGMARRRVRWRNVGRVACLAAAGVLIATHGRHPPADTPRRLARTPPAAPEVQRLPRLRDIPRLVLPRPRKRRAMKGGDPGRSRGVRRIMRPYDAQDGKHPSPPDGERADQAPPPSPPPGGAGQRAAEERSALAPERSAPAPAPAPAPPPAPPPPPPTSGEFTPDPAP